MLGFLEFVLLSAVMGLSIFLSLPIVLHPRSGGRIGVVLNAAAIGILLFLLADIFSDVAPLIASPTTAFLTVPSRDVAFAVPFVLAFLVLVLIDDSRGRTRAVSPAWTAFVIAVGMGLQNLSEGLVFGSAWAAGAVGLLAVVFTGFLLQNITEGFPIAAPYLGAERKPLGLLITLFLVGGLPTIVGGILGYFYNSAVLDLAFDGAAMGAIAYVLLPMLKAAFRPADTPEKTAQRLRLLYFGVLAGFLLGFLVNAV
ncbi:MAG: hypothetical protein L3K00_02545 [Thermoplasmata archaeon]|nr:hypothetical protein [Thermoplasmata archaeon]